MTRTADPAQGPRTRVVDELREAIIRGRYGPGDSLSEVVLAEIHGVSRTPIREALKQLQVEGLVEVRSRVGTFVRRPSRREVVELFQIKEMLEGLGARLLALRGEVAETALLRENLLRSAHAARDRDVEAYSPSVHEFHDLIVRGADNTRLAHHYRQLTNQLAYPRLVTASLRRPGRLEASLGEQRAVFDRVVEKDGFGAEWAMRDHVRALEREVMMATAADPLRDRRDP
ncbi:GntR family transcriptional regulator [Nocardiopsis sp. MG754419]|uniref:GntR family transcriptional regulator n=1 Tax=Nocardiopsis sp. MG754419 TaxID=2259865 RepID=UPI0027DD3435|nr:GntR family transcriptional regulator [Nocardiopsis sp. MG754419]